MKQIDEARLETDLNYRYEYLCEFIGFGAEDVALIHDLASEMLARVPALVETTYERLLSFTATARHFMPRQHGFDGPLPLTMEALSQDAEQIKFRKEHLRRYLMSLVGNPYDARMVNYLDVVGKIHTPKAGNKAIDVPLVQMNALMGLLADILTEMIYDLQWERDRERRTLRAIFKLLWVQNDLINRHYSEPGGNGRSPKVSPPPAAASGWR